MNEWKRLKQFIDYEVSIDGKIRNFHSKRIINQSLSNGYFVVSLKFKPGIFGYKNVLVHRCVAIAFIPNYENKLTVNHKDGNKSNNHKDNLEWATQSENVIHAYKNGFVNRKLKKRELE